MEEDLKREIIMDNYLHPYNNERIDNDKYICVNSNNESCIDNINLYLLLEDDIIKDIKFDGEACAISTSSTSLLIQYLIGKTFSDGLKILNNYNNMINEKPYDSNVLGDLIVYNEIYKQKNRKNCALLSYRAIERVLNEKQEKESNNM